jgi:hypothetical protein
LMMSPYVHCTFPLQWNHQLEFFWIAFVWGCRAQSAITNCTHFCHSPWKSCWLHNSWATWIPHSLRQIFFHDFLNAKKQHYINFSNIVKILKMLERSFKLVELIHHVPRNIQFKLWFYKGGPRTANCHMSWDLRGAWWVI